MEGENNMKFVFKKPPCEPCEMQDKIKKAKDGDMVAVSERCAHCDYLKCNFILEKMETGTSDALRILEKRYGKTAASIAIEQEAHIYRLEVALIWSGKFDNITTKNMREFLQDIKKGKVEKWLNQKTSF